MHTSQTGYRNSYPYAWVPYTGGTSSATINWNNDVVYTVWKSDATSRNDNTPVMVIHNEPEITQEEFNELF